MKERNKKKTHYTPKRNMCDKERKFIDTNKVKLLK